jgi:hypothetical protein
MVASRLGPRLDRVPNRRCCFLDSADVQDSLLASLGDVGRVG